jgi:hypothetical protein
MFRSNDVNMRTVVSILASFIFFGLNAQKGNLIVSRWHAGDKIEDSDYQLIKKARLYYFVSNDNDNIYIRLKTSERVVQEKILKQGLTVWINMDDKNQAKMGIRYPIGSENQNSNKRRDKSNNADSDTLSVLSMANTIELVGFISEQERRFPAQNPDNFNGSVKYEQGIFYYKMVMPIAKLPIRNSRQGNGAMPFTLGFEYGFIPQMQSSSNSSTGSRGGSADLNWINHVKLATSR